MKSLRPTARTPYVLTEKAEVAVSQPQCSRIIGVEPSRACVTCGKAGVMVRIERCTGEVVYAWTHDDGSFIEWTGELHTQ